MPLHKFIHCMCDGILQELVIKGRPTTKRLASAWESIMDEYLSLLSDSKDKYTMNLTRDIYMLEYNIHRTAMIQKYLFYRNDLGLAQELIDKGVVLQPWPKDDLSAQGKWLIMVTATIKRWVASLEQKKAELKRTIPDFTSQKMDRKYFNDMLAVLSKHCGYHLNEYTMTTGRYISILLDYRTYVKEAEKQLNKK